MRRVKILLLLIPQRYKFSSKSQLDITDMGANEGCCWYHKGTNFQANHNTKQSYWFWWSVVADTTKVQIFKQITTSQIEAHFGFKLLLIPQRYKFSSKSQPISPLRILRLVVADTTKVQIFKQITTLALIHCLIYSCCWYHKGTNFQANHNVFLSDVLIVTVVADTTKVQIFKQITTS